MADKPILQLLLSGEPLSAAEVREMIVRHIVSAPNDERVTEATANLLDAYGTIWMRDHFGTVMPLVSYADAEKIMQRHFSETLSAAASIPVRDAEDVWFWPNTLPREHHSYPLAIIEEVGAALGLKAAANVTDQDPFLAMSKN